MVFSDLKNISFKAEGAISLENFAPRRLRKILKEFLVLSVPVAIALSMFFSEESHLTIEKLLGIIFGVLFLWIVLFMLDAFFYSMYFEDIKPMVPERGFGLMHPHVSFELLCIVYCTDPDDITEGFVNSSFGNKVFFRLNIDYAARELFLKRRRGRISGKQLRLPHDPSLASYVGAIFDADAEFAVFIENFGFNKNDILDVADWVSRQIIAEKIHLRWWSRDSLGRIRGIGKDWAHGKTYHLEKYGKYLVASDLITADQPFSKEVASLERILVRNEEANALIVGSEYDEMMEIVEELARQIADGSVLSMLEHKRLFILDDHALIKATMSRTDLEREFINVLEEAQRAGHIIFVIPNLASFVASAENFGVDVLKIMDPYLFSSRVQIIALIKKDSYIDKHQKNLEFMSQFEKILVSRHERELTLHVLEEKISKIEKRTSLFFTYPALLAMSKNKEKYFSGDHLKKFVSKMLKSKKEIITASDL